MKKFKRTMAALLAAALTLAVASPAILAADPTYAVGDVSNKAFKVDNGSVDLSKSYDSVAYGKTVYFPLLNDGTGSSAAQQEFDQANSNLTAAINAYLLLRSGDMMSPEFDALADFGTSGNYNNFAAAFAAQFSNEKSAATNDYTNKNNARNTAVNDFNDANTALTTAGYASIGAAESKETELKGYRTTLSNVVTAAGGTLAANGYDIVAGSQAEKVHTFAAAYTALSSPDQTTFSNLLAAYVAAKAVVAEPNTEVYNKVTTFNAGDASARTETAVDLEVAAINLIASGASKLADSGDPTAFTIVLADPSDAKTLYDYGALSAAASADIKTLLTSYLALTHVSSPADAVSKDNAITGAQGNYNATTSGELDTLSGLIEEYRDAEIAYNNAPSETAVANALALSNAYNNAALNTAVTNVGTKKTAYDEKKAALPSGSTGYPFVYETDSKASSGRIKATWDLGRSLVNKVEIVKKKAKGTFEGTSINIDSFPSSQRYIYFVAISIKSSSTYKDADLDGVVNIKRTSNPKFEVEFNPSLTIGYEPADDNVIGTSPKRFSEGDGFSGEEDEIFEFEADADSYFEVDTRNQKDIVLAFDTDFDSDIAEVYPKANLDFYNGNGASFNKIGTLYLYAPEGSYLYYVNSNGDLAELAKSQYEYDEYEEAFAIKTRTLGRYVVSDTKLKLVTTSTGSSSSSSSVTSVPSGSTGGHNNPPTGIAF